MALVCMAATPVTLPAQGFLEQFSYEGLRLSGLGVEMGGVVSDRLTAEPSRRCGWIMACSRRGSA